MITNERMEELYELWNAELDDDRWITSLDSEEYELIMQWDAGYNVGMAALCDAIRNV